MNEETVEFEDCLCRKETAKAILVRRGDDEKWVPKSQVTADSEVYAEGHVGTLVVTAWFAEKEGLFE